MITCDSRDFGPLPGWENVTDEMGLQMLVHEMRSATIVRSEANAGHISTAFSF